MKNFPYQFLCFCTLLFAANCRSLSNPNNNSTNAGYEISWDQSTLMQIGSPAAGGGNHIFSYPRMIELVNGSLICAYEHNGNIELVRSTDNGINWSNPEVVVTNRNRINIANPELLQLSNGTLLLAYNLRPRRQSDGNYDPEKKFSICIRRNANNGASWEQEQLLYEAGPDFKNGCWEPSMLQLPSGEIQLFFANEGIYTQTEEQNISMLKSSDDGVSWSSQPQIVCFSSSYRDGMPVPVFDKKGSEILLAIEDNSEGGQFNPSVIKIPQPWDGSIVDARDVRRVHLLKDQLTKSIYSGAPYITTFKNGAYAISFQSTLGRGNDWEKSSMQVAVGESLDKLRLTDQPFNVPLDKGAKWSSIYVLSDQTIVALTSTDAFNPYVAIWAIKGKLKIKK